MREITDRRKLVDDSYEVRDMAGLQRGRLQYPGNAERRLVEKEAVRLLAVLAERFAVVRRDREDEVAPEAPIAKMLSRR